MSLLIKNGRIVTATDDYTADIYCENQTISRIETHIDAMSVKNAEVIDASGMLVFPGFIDPHVHVYLPFMGTYAKDTWETASRAALIGGTTTLIEMICPNKIDQPMAAFETWLGKANGAASCDFTFHMGVTRFDEMAEKELREIVKRGVTSFKVLASMTASCTRRCGWRRSWASWLPPTAKMKRWSSSARRSCSPLARPARSSTGPRARCRLRPRACTTS
jgi:dihydropyrimidinase